MNQFSRDHKARIRNTWRELHGRTGERSESLTVLGHNETTGGLTTISTVPPKHFFLGRPQENALGGNSQELQIAWDALPLSDYVRAVAFQFRDRVYARKDRHPDSEQPAGVAQYFAFLLEPKEVV